jgi:2-haloacid dehalogenase
LIFFLEADARIIQENIFSYANVLQRVAQSVAKGLQVRSDPALELAFVDSVPAWPVFEETNPCLSRLARRYRLAIISNIDDHLILQTIKQFDVPFDVIVTSEQAKSYKPDRAIFDRAINLIGKPANSIIHIAEGRCEAAPARALGIRSIWVKRSLRSDDGSNAQPDAVVSNLTQILEAIS